MGRADNTAVSSDGRNHPRCAINILFLFSDPLSTIRRKTALSLRNRLTFDFEILQLPFRTFSAKSVVPMTLFLSEFSTMAFHKRGDGAFSVWYLDRIGFIL
jgi:hypothetical protein